jgi:hypothetical protein
MDDIQDIFISHASSDKQDYIQPLANALTTYGVSFWLDNIEIGWGDNFVLKINEGLRSSRFALLCLSKNFLSRPWTESEMSSVLAIQNSDGRKRALPLILNSKQEIFQTYPLLSALNYREYDLGVDVLARELSETIRKSNLAENLPDSSDNLLEVIIESVHTGQLCNLRVSPKVSIKWLVTKAQNGVGVKEEVDVGAFKPFRIRWVLVDVEAEDEWNLLSRWEQQELYAVVKTDDGVMFSFKERDRIEDFKLRHKTVFHLYAVEDGNYDRVCYQLVS